MKTKAVETAEGDFILNGSKMFISGGGVSDLYIVMAKTGEQEVSAFIIEKDTKGYFKILYINFRFIFW